MLARSSGTGPPTKVTVDDAAFIVAEFEKGPALESTVLPAAGISTLEICGGSSLFDLERMNELEYLNLADPADEQGFRTILVTNATHPYVAAWWPPGHIIGYEHEFTHAVAYFLTAMDKGTKITPNLLDGMKDMQVLEAAITSARTGQRVNVSDIK
jgi:predicted dehydrogenase